MWDTLTADVADTLRDVRPGQYVVVEFVEHEGVPSWSPWPYAQCAWEPEGWYCEAVSARFLPADQWPLDELALRRSGWHAPSAATENWSTWSATAGEAAAAMVDALRHSRDCQDPSRYRWEVRTFPTGPDGGEPLPVRRPPLSLAA